MKVVLDTDTGVDDALAIILALRSPELDVRAITTVAGNIGVDECVRNVLRVLSLLGLREAPPVARGCSQPLVRPPFDAARVHGTDGLGDLDPDFFGDVSDSPLMKVDAVSLLLSLIRQFPEDLTIIATAPLTNIATAIQRDPRTMRMVHKIIVMGGAVDVPGNIPPGAAEFNFFVDPHAADRVLSFGVPTILVPLDVTHRTPLGRQLMQESLGDSTDVAAQFALRATKKYMDFYLHDQGHDGCYLHDPLAVGVAIDESLVRLEDKRVYVETEGRVTAGMTLAFRHPTMNPTLIPAPNVSVCTAVQSERFMSLFLRRIRGESEVGRCERRSP